MDMEEARVDLARGVNLRELMGGRGSEFQIDNDFQEAPDRFDSPFYEDLMVGSDCDSDNEDVLKQIESSVEKFVLSSPEYLSFDNLATKMIDVVPSGDVKLLILEEGSGPLVPIDAHVTLHYAAYWEGEKVSFDTTLTMNNGAPAKFKLGSGAILPGLEAGLTLVHGPTARFHLLLSPKVTWGEMGVQPRIRNERALFCVTLLSVHDVGAVERFNSLPSAEQKKLSVTIATVEATNSLAKKQFHQTQYIKAIRHYHKSISVLQQSEPQNDDEIAQIKMLKCKVYINLAICYSKLNRPKKVLLMCDELVHITSIENNCQAQYWYGKAFSMLGEFDEAKKFFKRALQLKPKNADVAREMIKLDEAIQKARSQEKSMWKKAFLEKNRKDKNLLNVDHEFKMAYEETCESLSKHDGVVTFKLPSGLNDDEVQFLRNLVDEFDTLSFSDEEVRGEQRLAIIKNL